MPERLMAIVGIVVILGIALALSNNRRAVRWRVVSAAFGLHAALAVIILFWTPGREALATLSAWVLHVINYSRDGIELVFGGLASESIGFSFAINALPIVIFFSALMSVLYHLGIMQRIVQGIGGLIGWVTGIRAAESMNAAANIFVGQTEAPLAIRPYLAGLSEAQLFTVMVSGMASVAGTMLGAYTLMGAELEHILAASVMAAPGSLLMAKIMMPDAVDPEGSREGSGKALEPPAIETARHQNVILAAATGASDGMKLAINIAAMLIAFVSLIALLNGALGLLGSLVGWDELSLQTILGFVFAPLMAVLSIPWAEAQAAGALFGEKLVLNEFIAFGHMNEYLATASDRTRAIMTFALCGFANFASIAVLLGGLGSLIPEKRDMIADLGVRAVIAASLANLMSAALAGLLL